VTAAVTDGISSKSMLVLAVGSTTAGNGTLAGLLAAGRSVPAAAGVSRASATGTAAPPVAAPAAAAAAVGNQQRPQMRQTPAANPQQQQQQQQQQAQPQPVMQLLSCSTLLSPCCSSNKLGSVSNSVTSSCLRIGSISLGHEGWYVAGVGSTSHSLSRTSVVKTNQGQQQQQDQLMILMD
jgi:hypothetical protein